MTKGDRILRRKARRQRKATERQDRLDVILRKRRSRQSPPPDPRSSR